MQIQIIFITSLKFRVFKWNRSIHVIRSTGFASRSWINSTIEVYRMNVCTVIWIHEIPITIGEINTTVVLWKYRFNWSYRIWCPSSTGRDNNIISIPTSTTLWSMEISIDLFWICPITRIFWYIKNYFTSKPCFITAVVHYYEGNSVSTNILSLAWDHNRIHRIRIHGIWIHGIWIHGSCFFIQGCSSFLCLTICWQLNRSVCTYLFCWLVIKVVWEIRNSFPFCCIIFLVGTVQEHQLFIQSQIFDSTPTIRI